MIVKKEVSFMIITITIVIDIITLVVQFLIFFQYINTEKKLNKMKREITKILPGIREDLRIHGFNFENF
jgi:hypothetical protein